ncbi:hypothetical protein CDAR_393581 [Caerostris darwini]|uniref:Uncharacterized protein n=1 Tax=Caerostris darwini TaxID=1538125 RepID=A0AAV4W9P7_9ARAC|nr:hypothetical protein CDAR_393581 [Caerostris darwini]
MNEIFASPKDFSRKKIRQKFRTNNSMSKQLTAQAHCGHSDKMAERDLLCNALYKTGKETEIAECISANVGEGGGWSCITEVAALATELFLSVVHKINVVFDK